MNRRSLIYRIIFLGLTILVIPLIPILIIYLGVSSPEYVIHGTLNMDVSQKTSIWELYIQILQNLITLDLGNSISSGQPVISEIINGFAESFKSAFPALILSYIIGTLIGVKLSKGSTNKNNKYDFIFYVPMIVFSYLFLFMADKLGIDFTSGIKYVFAIIILAIYPTFIVSKSFSTNYQSLITSDYYRFHLASGFSKKSILKKFTARYFAIEYLVFFENIAIYLFGFIYFVEAPFAIHGVGYKFVTGIQRFDYPLIIGFCIVSIILFSVINIIVDFIKQRIDTRVI